MAISPNFNDNSREYQSPAGSNSNDGALPTTYIPSWKLFNNLTPQQILAFESFPQDLLFYSETKRWEAEEVNSGQTSVNVTPIGGVPTTISLNTDDRSKTLLIGMRQAVDDGLMTQVPLKDANGNFWTLDVAGAKAAHQAVQGFILSLFATEATLAVGINGKTITTRKQIDAAYAAVAPNSPSALQPSLT